MSLLHQFTIRQLEEVHNRSSLNEAPDTDEKNITIVSVYSSYHIKSYLC